MAKSLNCVLNRDCIKGMASLDAETVDLVFADPPFNIGYEYDVYEDRRATDDYLNWSAKWMAGVKRVLKPDGTFWLAIGDEYAAELKVHATRELGFHCRSWVIWFYTFGVHCTKKFTRSHAHLFHFVKDAKNFTFNAEKTRVPSARQLVYGDKRAAPGGRMPDDTWMIPAAIPSDTPMFGGFVLRPQDLPDRFPPDSDTWYFPRVAGTFGERKGWHGCQMPEQLLGRIIRASSNEGDLVLDPFGGSGTTLAVAKKLERNFLGFELSKSYAKNIKKRLSEIEVGDELIGSERPERNAPSTKAGRRLKNSAPLIHDHKGEIARPKLRASHDAQKPAPTVTCTPEGRECLIEAFRETHSGYSADRVIADPSLNARFIDRCEHMGLPGAPVDWNRGLLNLRKRRALAVKTTKKERIGFAKNNEYLFASEIACKTIKMLNNCSLDDVLCNPDLRELFIRQAEKIAPGFQSFEYCWAAFALRKNINEQKKVEIELVNQQMAGSLSFKDHHMLPPSSAHYMISFSDVAIYLGFAERLQNCRLFRPETIGTAAEIAKIQLPPERDIKIAYSESSLSAGRAENLRMAMVAEYRPKWNVEVQGTAA